MDFCSIPRTAQEIMDFIGISNQSKNRKKYIANLVDAGILEMTIPNFPKDKKQKYRKVPQIRNYAPNMIQKRK